MHSDSGAAWWVDKICQEYQHVGWLDHVQMVQPKVSVRAVTPAEFFGSPVA